MSATLQETHIDPEVVYLGQDPAPRTVWSGERMLELDLPPGTRVIYPRAAMRGLRDVPAAIRYALNRPEDGPPLRTFLRRGMRVKVVVEDHLLTLAIAARPDPRQLLLEELTRTLDEAGVDDYQVLLATAPGIRLAVRDLRRIAGDELYDRLAPTRLYKLDGTEGLSGDTTDLIIYSGVHCLPLDRRPRWLPPASPAIFCLEAAVNNRYYAAPFAFLTRNEDRYTRLERKLVRGLRATLSAVERLSPAARLRLLRRVPGARECTAVYAGSLEAVRAKILRVCRRQNVIRAGGQADILLLGIPATEAFQLSLSHPPELVRDMALDYFEYLIGCAPDAPVAPEAQVASERLAERELPLLKTEGVLIVFFPCRDEQDARFDSEVHPLRMWYRGAGARRHQGPVIVVGAEHPHVPERLGWRNAANVEEALAMARQANPGIAQITLLKQPPPFMARCV
jgi:hypothetical protein